MTDPNAFVCHRCGKVDDQGWCAPHGWYTWYEHHNISGLFCPACSTHLSASEENRANYITMKAITKRLES